MGPDVSQGSMAIAYDTDRVLMGLSPRVQLHFQTLREASGDPKPNNQRDKRRREASLTKTAAHENLKAAQLRAATRALEGAFDMLKAAQFSCGDT